MWKKKAAATALALVMAIQGAIPAFAAGETNENAPSVTAEAADTAENARIKETINKGWQFKYYGSDTGTPTAEAFDDSNWDTVNVPHTWNNLDGQDGGNNMARGNGWYRKKLEWKSEYAGKQIFLEFLGASRDVTVYVNGTQAGDMHRGAYTAFRYDITDKLKNGTNVIAVKTDNTFNTSVIPLSGDFNVYGGIYRDVSLVIADPVHVDLEDYGSNGLYLQTGNVSEASGDLTVRSTIVNDGTQSKQVTVKAVVKEGVDSFEEIEEISDPMFDVEDMLAKDKEPVATLTDTFTLAGGAEMEFSESVTVLNPHLWNGLTDPFRYQVDLTVEVDGKVVDYVSDYVGFRYFNVNIDTGFYLNGESCPLRGVSRHQDWEDMGCAISTKEHDVDFGMIYEIGANTIRLAHYPHDPYFYDLCDRYGMVVWAEIPFVDQVGTADDFYEITERQLIEMIRQQYNRPGICFWGLQNEVGNSGNPGGNNSAGMDQIMANLNTKAHAEDTTGRLTTQATNGNASWVSDLLAWNTYPGWYNGGLNAFEGNIDGKKSSSRPVGISEYGFGGNIEQHEIPANKPASTTGQWHPEEYQSLGHEKAVEVFDTRKWVWGTYVWCMFDFACDKRAEGDNPGINDKGIVTYDRKIRKDSFYIYKANWNQREKFAHITSSRLDTNAISSIPFVKVYSNCASVELFVDGVSKGLMTNEGYGIFKWTEDLAVRENMVIEAVATDTDGKTYTDRATLKRKLGTVAELQSDVLVVDNERKTIGLTGNIDASDLADILTGAQGATYYVTNENDEPVTTGNITFGMKAVVTSEDEETTEIYTFVSTYISAGKNVTASSEQTGTTDNNPKENAVDGNSETRWAANTGGGNQWICVDLGEEYFLSQIRIDWFNNTNKRSYQYTIDVSDDAANWRTSVIDRSNNSEQDSVTDTFPAGTTGRYVRISVSGIRNSSGSSVTNINASMYEIAIHGWNITSTAYDIDHTENIIRIPDNVPMVGGNLPDYAFMEGLELKGNYTYKLDMNSYFITGNNDSLTITDEAGEEKVYRIYFATGSPEIPGDVIDVTGITLSESSCSMETGQTKQVGLALTPANATRRAVLWASSNPEAVTVSRNGKLTAVGEGEAVITATSAYTGVASNELKVSVSLSEGYILKGALTAVEAALEQLHVTNDTTDEDVMAAVRNAITMEGITAQWTTDFQKVESTETEQGRITGQIRLELGKSFVTLIIDKTISSGEDDPVTKEEAEEAAGAALTASDSLHAAGQGNYTQESWEAFDAAYRALKDAKEDAGTEPAELKKLADDLDAARKGLALDEKKVLDGAGAAVEADAAAIRGGNTIYTAATWKAYADAYAALKSEADKGEAAELEKLDALKKAFDAAKRSLKADTAWQNAKTALTRSLSQAQATYANGKGNDNKKYTDASWNTFAAAYAAAYAQRNAIAGNSAASRLNALAKALNDAKAKLAPAPTLKKGDSVTQDGVTYVVLDPVKKTASAQGEASKKKKKFKVSIKDTVDINNVMCTVTEVKAKGFAKFSKITQVKIGKNVTKIGKQAFKDCKAITKLMVNGNVKTFDTQCFQNCKKLNSMAFKGTKVSTFKSKAFKGTASKMTVKLAKKMSKSNKKKIETKLKSAGISKKAKIR